MGILLVESALDTSFYSFARDRRYQIAPFRENKNLGNYRFFAIVGL